MYYYFLKYDLVEVMSLINTDFNTLVQYCIIIHTARQASACLRVSPGYA